MNSNFMVIIVNLRNEATFQVLTNLQKNWGKAADGILGKDAWNILLNN